MPTIHTYMRRVPNFPKISRDKTRFSTTTKWLAALLLILALEGSSMYFATQPNHSSYFSNSRNGTLILDPLIAQAVFPIRAVQQALSIRTNLSRSTFRPRVASASATAAPKTPVTSPDGSVTISPTAEGSNTPIDAGGNPTTIPDTTVTTGGGGTTASTGTGSTTGTSTTTTTGSFGTSTTVTTPATGSTTVSTPSIPIPTVSVPPVPPVLGGGITLP